MKSTIAWIGLGRMGAPMAANLLRAGFPLVAYNRSAAPAEKLAALGARIASTPRLAASQASAVVVTVATPEAFEQVLLGPDGIIAGLTVGSLLLDMGTDGVEMARRAGKLAAERGAGFVDAPVLGSRRPAEQAQLVVMAGGEARDIERAGPIFLPLARAIHHVGPVGSGQAMKLAVNLMLAHMLSGLAGSMAFARALNLQAGQLVEILEAGLGSPYFGAKGRQMIEGDYAPQFTLDLARKDVRLIRAALADVGMQVPTIEPIMDLFDEAARRGWGGEDGAAVFKLWDRS